jgi:hypothetical protein
VEHDHDPIEDRMAQIRQLTMPAAFDAGFAERVMARLERPRALSDGLERVFVRLVPFAAAAALLFGAMNLINTRASGLPLVDRVLGLQPVTVATAYMLDAAITQPTERQP